MRYADSSTSCVNLRPWSHCCQDKLETRAFTVVAWITSSEFQGFGTLIALLETVGLLSWRLFSSMRGALAEHTPTPPSAPEVPAQSNRVAAIILGLAIFLALGWVIYAIPWTVFAFSFNYEAWWTIAWNPLFLVLGSLPPIGSALTSLRILGGGLDGGLPLGVLALLFATNNPDMVTFASPFAYFVVFGVFGAFIGAVTGPATVSLVRALRLPLPLRGK